MVLIKKDGCLSPHGMVATPFHQIYVVLLHNICFWIFLFYITVLVSVFLISFPYNTFSSFFSFYVHEADSCCCWIVVYLPEKQNRLEIKTELKMKLLIQNFQCISAFLMSNSFGWFINKYIINTPIYACWPRIFNSLVLVLLTRWL